MIGKDCTEPNQAAEVMAEQKLEDSRMGVLGLLSKIDKSVAIMVAKAQLSKEMTMWR